MSPKPHQLCFEDMDMEISQSARGSTDLALEPPVPVVLGQDLVQVPAYEIAVAETPDKRRLKKQVSDLVEALNYEEKNGPRKDPRGQAGRWYQGEANLKGPAGQLQKGSYRI